MSVSIYYKGTRRQPISSIERTIVEKLIAKYSIEEQLKEYFKTGSGLNWESFGVYDLDKMTEPCAVFEGATKLPDNSEDATWIGIQHWCKLLSEIRLVLPGAMWSVHVDDHEMIWNEQQAEYDPWQ